MMSNQSALERTATTATHGARWGIAAVVGCAAVGLGVAYRPWGLMALLGLGSAMALLAVGEGVRAAIRQRPAAVSNAAPAAPPVRHEVLIEEIQRLETVVRMSRGVAHDFSNALTVIGIQCEFMLEGMNAGDPLHDEIRQVYEASGRATALTRQLLDFTRPRVLEVGPLNLNDVVRNAAPMLERLLGREIAVELDLDDTIGIVLADAGQMQQLIANLAVNARDAMPGGGFLRIATANTELDELLGVDDRVVAPGEYVMLAVSDTGSGMSGDVQARIFEPFFTTKPAGVGTGVGLTTVSNIVRQNGGYIWVHSVPGDGTVFKIYLPLSAGGRRGAGGPSRASVRRGGRETVLLIEDVSSVRAAARRTLEREGYRVLDAPRGPAALVTASSFDGELALILTDFVMPNSHGAWLEEGLLARHPEARVLYMSGYTDADVKRRGLEAAAAVVQKPFTSEALLRAVRAALDAGAAGRHDATHEGSAAETRIAS